MKELLTHSHASQLTAAQELVLALGSYADWKLGLRLRSSARPFMTAHEPVHDRS